MTNQEAYQTVINRANEMKQNAEINNIYQSFDNESDAKDWLIKAAIATLMGVQHEN